MNALVVPGHVSRTVRLELCHSVVDELRAKLAGHSTRALPANDEEDDGTRLG